MFRELYYILYDLLRQIKTNTNPMFNAFIGICFFQGMNILSLVGIAKYFLSLDISKNTAVFSGIIISISLSVLNFFSLFKKRYEIIEHYNKRSAKRESKGRLYFWLYVLTTIGLFIYVILNMVTPKY